MSFYDRLADLDVTISDWALERAQMDTSSGFTRETTTFAVHGDDEEGRGEDVSYDAEDHQHLAETGVELPTGTYSFDDFSAALDDVDLFPGHDPERETARHYRRWAVESAGLDLALRQADTDIASALGRTYDPVRFVVSTRLDDPPTVARVEQWLSFERSLEFKLDPTSDWDEGLVDALASTGSVRVLDLKGRYEGTSVDQEPDPALYRLVLEGFPEAVVEDPALTDETRHLFEGHEDRVSWDYPITGVESVRELPWEPTWLNVKPSRFGTVESLLDTIEYCTENDVRLYGGGQFELGVGRDHVQAIASVFYPDAPNDVAPSEYNAPKPREGLPSSPLSPSDDPRGLSW